MVTPIRPQDATGIYRQQVSSAAAAAADGESTSRSGGAAPRQRTDQVQLSDRARELQRALRAANETPEVRQQLVESLRQQVEAGTYTVDPAFIAQRLAEQAQSGEQGAA